MNDKKMWQSGIYYYRPNDWVPKTLEQVKAEVEESKQVKAAWDLAGQWIAKAMK